MKTRTVIEFTEKEVMEALNFYHNINPPEDATKTVDCDPSGKIYVLIAWQEEE